MGFGTIAQQKTRGFGSVKADVNTSAGLLETAEKAGLGEKARSIIAPPKKLSVLQRLGTGLGAFNPAEALLTAVEKKSFLQGTKKYVKNVVVDVAEAISGRDLDKTKRRTFKDVAEKAGIENKILKGGIGFIGDVVLDPSTYFGGAIAKGLGFTAKGITNTSLKGIGKVAPKAETGLRLAGQGIREAAGKAFKYGFGTSKGLPEKALEIQSKLAKTKEGIVASNLARLGTGTLSKSQQEELVQKLLAGKRAEFSAKSGASLVDDLDSLAQEARKYKSAEELGLDVESKGHVLDALPRNKQIETLKIGSERIGKDIALDTRDLSRQTTGKLTSDYWLKKIKNGERPAILVGLEDGKLKVIDGNHRATAYVQEGVKDVPVIMTKEAQNFYNKAVGGGSGKTLAREVAKSTDPLVQKTIGEQATRSQKFAKQAGIQDPYEIYFPGLKADKVEKFLEGTKVLKVGSQGYLKQFKNLLTDDDLIKNPAEAFAKREFDIAKDNIVKSELNQAIKQYGKPLTAFKNADDALKEGYKVVKEKGLYGKEIGYLKDVDKKFLDDLISPEFTSIDMIAKATGFDALTSLFKRSVTGLFPAFHVRNYVSGHIQNFETLGIGALNPKIIASGQKMAWKLAQDDKSLFKGAFGKEMKAFADRFGTSSSYIADIADATKGMGNLPGKILSKESIKETAKTLGLGQQAIPFRSARAVGNFIETQQKAAAYLTALGKGKTIEEALELATRAGFDYRALTGFESKILRRIIPFYSFTRKNIELQLKTLGENPQRINQIMRLMDNMAGDISEEEKASLPDYAKEGFTIKTGTSESGLPEIATGFGTPVEAFTGLFGFGDKSVIEKQLSTLNNIIKYPLERAVGKDFFRDRPLSEVVEATEYSKMPDFVKDFLELREVKSKDFKTGKEKIKYTANPNRLHLLRQLPTTRGVTTLYNIYNGDVSAKSRWLYGTTGIKPRPIDLETEQYFKDKKQQEALEDLLLRSGIIKKFENVYIPKEK